MRADAKKRFRQARPGPCRYCGTVIRCDMYRHVAKFHLDLAQLWRCPVSWCTVWKGTPKDCMDHVRGVHDVPWIAKKANMEKSIPPWTVCRQMWLDSLKAGHSGISTDIMLFSDLGLSLTHHYRIHRHGFPHIAFWWEYMSKLRALLPVMPETGSPSSGQSDETPRRPRRYRRRIRPVRVMWGSVGDLPILMLQDPADVQGAVVHDCRPRCYLYHCSYVIWGRWLDDDRRGRPLCLFSLWLKNNVLRWISTESLSRSLV